MGINIISLFNLIAKNFIIVQQANYKIYNNKEIVFIYTKISNDYVKFMKNYLDIAIIMAKFMLQFANKI